MLLFWRQGYTATSLTRLLEVMGISRSSFYAAYGDKRSLFIEALTLFADRTLAILDSQMKHSRPFETVKRFFDKTTFDIPRWRRESGCMMVNTILELADVDHELSSLAAEKLADIEAALSNIFAETSRQPDQISSIVMTLNKGVRVSSRAGASTEELSQVISSTLKILQQAA